MLQIEGGPGDDLIDNANGPAGRLMGFGGNDIIYGSGFGDEIYGDTPNYLSSNGVLGFDQIFGRGGNDFFGDTSGDDFVEQLFGGGGQDQYSFLTWYPGAAVDEVMDFQVKRPGAPLLGGDSLGVTYLLGYSDRPYDELDFSPDLSGIYDPWAAGYLRLAQQGLDTLLQIDLDGPSGESGWMSVINLKNVDASTLTTLNFDAYSPPHAFAAFIDQNYVPAVVYLPVGGDDGANSITGTRYADTLIGQGGADILSGHGGDDLLQGGADNDTLRGGGGDDVLEGGAGDDVLNGGGGNDVLRGGVGDDVLRGGAGSDIFEFFAGDGSDTITDFEDGDILTFDASFFGSAASVGSLVALKTLVEAPSGVAAGATVHFAGDSVILDFIGGGRLAMEGVRGEWIII